MSATPPNGDSKLQQIIEKFGSWAAIGLFSLVVFMYQSDRTQLIADTKAVAARTSANERAIGRLQSDKASREELKVAIDSVAKDNATFRSDFKDSLNTLKTDLIARMDLIANKK